MNFTHLPGATPIDPDELAELIPDLSTLAELDEFESLNIREAIRWARKSAMAKQKILTIAALKRVHLHMFGKTWRWAGRFRRTQKNIGVESYQIGIELANLAEDVNLWIQHDVYTMDEVIARFHHRLVWIHPFPNGNGRFGRLAADILCLKQGWPVPTWGRANINQATETRVAYIQALRAADNHDIQPLIRFIRS